MLVMMAAQEKPLQWRDATRSWRLLSRLKQVFIVAPTLCWLVMAVVPVINTEWWLAHNETAFRVRWLVTERVAFLLSLGTLIGFVTWARRQNARHES
jgi:hypothetical protein